VGPGIALQRLAHVDVGDFIAGIVDFRQGLQGLFYAVGGKLGELKAAFAIELVLDHVFGSGGHGDFLWLFESAQLGAGATYDANLVGQRRLARDADCAACHHVQGDIPEPGAGCSDLGGELVERAAVVRVAAAILETAKICVTHQANITSLRAFDDDNVPLVEVLALVDKFHEGVSRRAFSEKSE
jgi:hypothetical protein